MQRTESRVSLRLGANNVLGDNCVSFFVRFPLTLRFRNWNEPRSQCDSEREYPTWIIQTLHLSRGVFARRSGWMEITWTRMEGPVRRRLWAEFRMSSYVFRETEVSLLFLCTCTGGFARSREKTWNCYWQSLWEKFSEDAWRNVCKCRPAPNSSWDP